MSYYPDGTTHPNWRPEIIVPQEDSRFRLDPSKIKSIVCHRVVAGKEEYLVKWGGKWDDSVPFSWHDLNELQLSLRKVQTYIESLPQPVKEKLELPTFSRKRKSPGSDDVVSISSSISRASPAISISSSSSGTSVPDPDAKAYNGTVKRSDGKVTIEQKQDGVPKRSIPTQPMTDRASKTDVRQALYQIRRDFNRRLATISGPRVSLSNDIDNSTPTLKFRFIDQNILAKGVEAAPPETVISCGHVKHQNLPYCSPNMGQNIGCEYQAACECMEYAAVDESRLTTSELKKQFRSGDTAGLPKRFPYYASVRRAGLLVSQYLNTRATIFECNPRCNCGPVCKTRVVQKGRTVPLEIFKTPTRGWGLRALENLQEGQFIDTYRGEIITNSEANNREERAKKEAEKTNKLKAIYLYNLDKFVGEGDLTNENCYVIDGEYVGGPTRFINHSCDPNCRQYVVSYNKSDLRIYTLAFFAYKAIPAGTELTFDYVDKDEPEYVPGSSQNIEEDGLEDAMTMDCKCGSVKCRGKIFI